MSKKRNRVKSVTPSPSPSPMRERETFARDIKSLRSAEAVKLRQNLLQVYNNETTVEPSQSRGSRPAPNRSRSEVAPRRHLPSFDEVSSQRMPAQVRDYLLDGIRTLSCERREARKETLFALRRIGKGKSGRSIRKAKWTANSRIRCK